MRKKGCAETEIPIFSGALGDDESVVSLVPPSSGTDVRSGTVPYDVNEEEANEEDANEDCDFESGNVMSQIKARLSGTITERRH